MAKSTLYATTAVAALLLQFTCCESASSSTSQYRPAFAFVPCRVHSTSSSSCSSPLSSTVTSSDATSPLDTKEGSSGGGDPESILQARNRLLALSTTLAGNSRGGKFISRPSDKIKLQKAVNELEALSPTTGDREKEMMLGDWTLVATANLPSSDIRRRFDNKNDNENNDTKKKGGWFNKNGKKKRRSGLSLFGSNGSVPLNPLQKSIQKSIEVTQRIRNDGNKEEDGGNINRVDNVIEFTPLDTLEDIIPQESPLFNLLGNVNVNPLQVKKSKVVLVHNAEVESVKPVLRTKIAWISSVLNVAGTSQYFDPEGADIFGLNNAFGEFINVGTFDTPYVDEDIRISRTSGPVLEQLRVFVRKESTLLENDDGLFDMLTAEMRVEEEKEVSESESSDVGTQVQKVVEATASMAENARSTIEKDMDGVNKALGETMDDVAAKVQDSVEDNLEQIGKAVEEVQSAIQDGDGDNIGKAISNVTKAVTKVPGDVRDIVEEDMSELADEVEEELTTMVADVQDSVESDVKDIGKSIEEIRDVATGGSTEDEKEDEEAKEE
ncbi:hypothetical protein ACHAXR_004020 [Thalassiosira sp. AJA248-18]